MIIHGAQSALTTPILRSKKKIRGRRPHAHQVVRLIQIPCAATSAGQTHRSNKDLLCRRPYTCNRQAKIHGGLPAKTRLVWHRSAWPRPGSGCGHGLRLRHHASPRASPPPSPWLVSPPRPRLEPAHLCRCSAPPLVRPRLASPPRGRASTGAASYQLKSHTKQAQYQQRQ